MPDENESAKPQPPPQAGPQSPARDSRPSGDEPVDGRFVSEPASADIDAEPAPADKDEAKADPSRKRVSGATVLIGVLLVLLGFTLAVQLKSNATDSSYASAREGDLSQILSDLDSTQRRLNQDIFALEQTKRELQSGAAGRDAALAQAKARADDLGILAGTLPAKGPGIHLRFTENTGRIKAGTLLNAVQELRGAGAEALQIEGGGGVVRIIASTSFVDDDGGVRVDGRRLVAPYTIRAIGDPATLRPAVEIHGGVVADVNRDGGNVIVNQMDVVEVSQIRPAPDLEYAQPVR